jgi:hypothetical protein
MSRKNCRVGAICTPPRLGGQLLPQCQFVRTVFRGLHLLKYCLLSDAGDETFSWPKLPERKVLSRIIFRYKTG